MKFDKIINWLLEGDVSIRYQAYADLLDDEKSELRKKISLEGWGAEFLSRRNNDSSWGEGFYQPKWISTHYTLLDLKNLGIYPKNDKITESLGVIFQNEKGPDGGIRPIGNEQKSDVCINGMALNYSSYFRVKEQDLKSVIDFLLSTKMKDGGFNCRSNRKGAHHSSLHSTLSVAEGILEYSKNGYTYRLDELQKAELSSREFILQHKLFISDHSGEIINKNFLTLSYPSRCYYDILRALEYFRYAGVAFENRMNDAIKIILKKQKKDGRWHLGAKHQGRTHFDMEKAGKPSRWNTLRALRVLKHFGIINNSIKS